MGIDINPFSANTRKWSNTIKQFVGNLSTNCLSVFDHFVRLALKGLAKHIWPIIHYTEIVLVKVEGIYEQNVIHYFKKSLIAESLVSHTLLSGCFVYLKQYEE